MRKGSTDKRCARGHLWTRDTVVIKRACLLCNRDDVAAYKVRQAQHRHGR